MERVRSWPSMEERACATLVMHVECGSSGEAPQANANQELLGVPLFECAVSVIPCHLLLNRRGKNTFKRG